MSLQYVLSGCLFVLFLGCGDAGVSPEAGQPSTGGEDGEMGAGGTDASTADSGTDWPGPMGGTGGGESAPCDVLVAQWDDDWLRFENEVLEITNERRTAGADCRSMGTFPPAPPFEGHELLRCAARAHSQDMAERGFFNHISPEGESPADRVQITGYPFRALGENIAAGAQSPRAVVDGWMNSDGHCANIMNPQLEELGVGYFFKESTQMRHFWTQVFGTR